MTPPLTPEQARALAAAIDNGCALTRLPLEAIALTLSTYADQADALTRLAEYEEAAGSILGLSDDYQTSAQHHPDHVLIPLSRFNKIVEAEARLRALQEK